jgi:hypothetical protein
MSRSLFWISLILILVCNVLIAYYFELSKTICFFTIIMTSIIGLAFLSKWHFEFQEAPKESLERNIIKTLATLKFILPIIILFGTLLFFTGMSSSSQIKTEHFEKISNSFKANFKETVYIYLLDETKSTNEFAASPNADRNLSKDYTEIKDKLIAEIPNGHSQNAGILNNNSLEFKRVVLAYFLNDLLKKDTNNSDNDNDEIIVGYLGKNIEEESNPNNVSKDFKINKKDIQTLTTKVLNRKTNLLETSFESVFDDLTQIISKHQKDGVNRHFVITILSDFLDDEWNVKKVKTSLNELCKYNNNKIDLEFNFVTIPTRFDKEQVNVNQFLEALNETACNCNKIKYDFESMTKQYHSQKIALNTQKQNERDTKAFIQLCLQLSSINAPTLNVQKYLEEDFKLLFRYDKRRNRYAILNNQSNIDYDALIYFTSLSNDYKKDALLTLTSSDVNKKELESLIIPIDYSHRTEMKDGYKLTFELTRGNIEENEVGIILYYKGFNQKFLIPIIPGVASDDPLIQFWEENI